MVRVKYVRDLDALSALRKIYEARGLTVVTAANDRIEAYDAQGMLRNIAAVNPS